MGTATAVVASEPALIGDVTERSLTLPFRVEAAGGLPGRVGATADPDTTSPVEQRKSRIGCSSIPFGATPVCPWRKSKNATPVTVASGQRRIRARAAAICRWRCAIAERPHDPSGDARA